MSGAQGSDLNRSPVAWIMPKAHPFRCIQACVKPGHVAR